MCLAPDAPDEYDVKYATDRILNLDNLGHASGLFEILICCKKNLC